MIEQVSRPLEDLSWHEYEKAYSKLVAISKQTNADIDALTTQVRLATEWENLSRSLYIATVNSGKLTKWAHGLIHEFPLLDEQILDQDTKNYFRLDIDDGNKSIVVAVFSSGMVMGKLAISKQEMAFYHPVSLGSKSQRNKNFENLIVTHSINSKFYVYSLKDSRAALEKIKMQSLWIPFTVRGILPVLTTPQNHDLFPIK